MRERRGARFMLHVVVWCRARLCGPANEDPLTPPGPEGSNGTGFNVWRDLSYLAAGGP
jgi:hypothetical protein